MISVKNLNYKNILKNINLEIKKGEYISLVGKNGSGKTTLAFLLAKLIFNDNLKDKIECKSKIALLFENPDNQLIGTTVEEDIAFGLQNLCYSREKINEKIDEILNELKIVDLKKREIISLSGGQKQKIAFASLLALDYDIYILDEATSMLDFESREMVLDLIREINSRGKTIIQITHFLEEISLANRIILLENSEIKFDGETKSFLKNKELLLKNRLI